MKAIERKLLKLFVSCVFITQFLALKRGHLSVVSEQFYLSFDSNHFVWWYQSIRNNMAEDLEASLREVQDKLLREMHYI